MKDESYDETLLDRDTTDGNAVVIEEPTTTEADHTFKIAGFGRRVLAFLIDGIVLSLFLIILGFLLRSVAFTLGPWGRLIGFFVLLSYWGITNSQMSDGQSIGKKVMKIAVIDRNHRYLSLNKSLPRALLLSLPALFNGWQLPVLQNQVIAFVASGFVIAMFLSLAYSLIFNRTTRQGIHDLLAGSYVVEKPIDLEATAPALPLVHRNFTYGLLPIGWLLVLGLNMAAANIAPSFLQNTLGFEENMLGGLVDLQTAIMDEGEYFGVGVVRNKFSSSENPGPIDILQIDAWASTVCTTRPQSCDEQIKGIARLVLDEYDSLDQVDVVNISVSNRFDLLLANGNLSSAGSGPPEYWRDLLSEE